MLYQGLLKETVQDMNHESVGDWVMTAPDWGYFVYGI